MLVAVGCAGNPAARVDPSPVPLSAEDAREVARLIRADDRREFEPEQFPSALDHPSGAVRTWAALVAGRMRDRGAVRPLISLLQDTDTAVAASVAFALGLIGDTLAVEPLAAALAQRGADHPTVLIEIAGALGRLGTPAAVRTLEDVLSSVPNDPRLAQPIAGIIEALSRAGVSPESTYARWLRHPDDGIRFRAAYALTRRPTGEAARLLLPLLDDADPDTRSMAIRSLSAASAAAAELPLDSVLPRLAAAASDADYGIRIEALRALGTFGTPAAVTILQASIGVDRPHETLVALESLARSGPAAAASVPVLLRFVTDQSNPPFLREIAVETIAGIDPGRLDGELRPMLTDPEWRVRSAYARAAARRRQLGIQPLVLLARDADARVAAIAHEGLRRALGPTGMGAVRALLIEALGHPHVRVRAEALRSLAWLEDPSLLPSLLDAYDRARRDVDNEAAIAAIDAIADLAHTGSVAPDRAFFARFPRPEDPALVQKAVDRFRQSATRVWGDADPSPPPAADAEYIDLVERWVRPTPESRTLPTVRFRTEAGSFDLLLHGDRAPRTVANFLRLVDADFFHGQEWTRVVANFIAQGGDPRGDTSGGPGYTIRDEHNRMRFLAGAAGMALSGRDSGGSQFFVTHSPQPHLDGDYTVFATVVSGLEVLERILPGDRVLEVGMAEQEEGR
jgi:cyclophilin family peptidyl-prolyl cis-trans isomerase/HEAT repeat protein